MKTMPIALSTDDLRFLQTVQELGQQGLSQEQIAGRLGQHPATMRYRIGGLGFRFTRRTELETSLSGTPLRELIASGAIETPAAEAETDTRSRAAAAAA